MIEGYDYKQLPKRMMYIIICVILVNLTVLYIVNIWVPCYSKIDDIKGLTNAEIGIGSTGEAKGYYLTFLSVMPVVLASGSVYSGYIGFKPWSNLLLL